MEYLPSYRDSLYHSGMEYDDYLMHHGIKGMKWGVRRYQNSDGSLTAAGKKHYERKASSSEAYAKRYNQIAKRYNKFGTRAVSDAYRTKARTSQIRANYMRAKASGDKATIKTAKKAYAKEIAKRLAVRNSARGAYNRYRSSGDSKVKAAAKVYANAALNPYYMFNI